MAETQMMDFYPSDNEAEVDEEFSDAHLVVDDDGNGENTLEVLRLKKSANVVGRSEDADVRLLHSSVSGKHAIIEPFADVWTIKDGSSDGKKSSNGTYLHGKKLVTAGTTLGEGDRIKFGSVSAIFRLRPLLPAVSGAETDECKSRTTASFFSTSSDSDSDDEEIQISRPAKGSTASSAQTPLQNTSTPKRSPEAPEENGSGSETELDEDEPESPATKASLATSGPSPAASVGETVTDEPDAREDNLTDTEPEPDEKNKSPSKSPAKAVTWGVSTSPAVEDEATQAYNDDAEDEDGGDEIAATPLAPKMSGTRGQIGNPAGAPESPATTKKEPASDLVDSDDEVDASPKAGSRWGAPLARVMASEEATQAYGLVDSDEEAPSLPPAATPRRAQVRFEEPAGEVVVGKSTTATDEEATQAYGESDPEDICEGEGGGGKPNDDQDATQAYGIGLNATEDEAGIDASVGGIDSDVTQAFFPPGEEVTQAYCPVDAEIGEADAEVGLYEGETQAYFPEDTEVAIGEDAEPKGHARPGAAEEVTQAYVVFEEATQAMPAAEEVDNDADRTLLDEDEDVMGEIAREGGGSAAKGARRETIDPADLSQLIRSLDAPTQPTPVSANPTPATTPMASPAPLATPKTKSPASKPHVPPRESEAASEAAASGNDADKETALADVDVGPEKTPRAKAAKVAKAAKSVQPAMLANTDFEEAASTKAPTKAQTKAQDKAQAKAQAAEAKSGAAKVADAPPASGRSARGAKATVDPEVVLAVSDPVEEKAAKRKRGAKLVPSVEGGSDAARGSATVAQGTSPISSPAEAVSASTGASARSGRRGRAEQGSKPDASPEAEPEPKQVAELKVAVKGRGKGKVATDATAQADMAGASPSGGSVATASKGKGATKGKAPGKAADAAAKVDETATPVAVKVVSGGKATAGAKSEMEVDAASPGPPRRGRAQASATVAVPDDTASGARGSGAKKGKASPPPQVPGSGGKDAEDEPGSKRARREGLAKAPTSSTAARSTVSAPRVLFTNVEVTSKLRKLLEKIGATTCEDVRMATHLVASNKEEGVSFKRSIKVMAGISVVEHIVDVAWLVEGAEHGFPVAEQPFIIRDPAAESRYGFNMEESLGSRDKVLAGFSIFCVPAPETAKVPPPGDMRLVVECAGGQWMANAKAAEKADKPLVLSCAEADAANPALAAQARALAARGPAHAVVTHACVLDAVMRKRLDLASYRLDPEPEKPESKLSTKAESKDKRKR